MFPMAANWFGLGGRMAYLPLWIIYSRFVATFFHEAGVLSFEWINSLKSLVKGSVFDRLVVGRWSIGPDGWVQVDRWKHSGACRWVQPLVLRSPFKNHFPSIYLCFIDGTCAPKPLFKTPASIPSPQPYIHTNKPNKRHQEAAGRSVGGRSVLQVGVSTSSLPVVLPNLTRCNTLKH
jgi:hypothetical protein